MSRIFLLGFEESHIYYNTTATQLAEHGQFLFRKGLHKGNDKYSEDDTLIRYGLHTYSAHDKHFGVVLNTAKSIESNCNKLNTALMLRNHGVKTPRIFLNKKNIEEFPVLRRRARHSRGRDIIFVKDAEQLKTVTGDFYMEFIESIVEYVVHVFRNKCIRLSKKEPNPEEKSHDYIRSYNRGWLCNDIFTHDPIVEKKAIEEAIKAVKFLGLDFAKVDVLVDKDKKVWVLETNTCPRLNRFGREVYIKTIYDFLDIPLPENTPMGLVRDWRFYNKIPFLYRHVYHNSSDRRTMEKGL